MSIKAKKLDDGPSKGVKIVEWQEEERVNSIMLMIVRLEMPPDGVENDYGWRGEYFIFVEMSYNNMKAAADPTRFEQKSSATNISSFLFGVRGYEGSESSIRFGDLVNGEVVGPWVYDE